MTAAWLIIAACLAHLMPEHIAGYLGGSRATWEFVCTGVESFLLWSIIGSVSRHPLLLGIAAWGALESLERPVCRLMLPMGKAPGPGPFLCDRVVNSAIAMSDLSLIFAALVAVYAADRIKL